MTVIVFAGPSLNGARPPDSSGVTLCPPAMQGDVYRALALKPKAIGIIDGYFDGVPSVWHKEILWALAQGVAIFGSASMGALRAAELDAFGMQGIGRIYEWYRDGVIEDDDEVALLHGPPETGYMPLSLPMVNVRATCAAAEALGVLDTASANATIAAAKALNYRDRAWARILENASGTNANADREAFAAWLATGAVDQKRQDAQALLDALASIAANGRRPRPVSFRFEQTDLWRKATRDWRNRGAPDADATTMDELRLQPATYRKTRTEAVLRALLLRECAREHAQASEEEKQAIRIAILDQLGIAHEAALDRWLNDNGFDRNGFEKLVEEEALADRLWRQRQRTGDSHFIATLALTGKLAPLRRRAGRKAERAKDATVRNATVPPPVLVEWYFAKRLNQAPPDDLDAYIDDIGLSSRQDFYRLLQGEYVFSQAGADDLDGEPA
jgi:hypothetical protein